MMRVGLWFLAVCATVGLLLAAAAPTTAADKEDPFAELIDKPAPEIKGDFALNGKVVKFADLKGKVILVDFWAVWCGPCIRTFPHLRDLHKKYQEKGLEIVGVTSYYEKFGFDKEAGKLVPNQTLTREDEREMLKAFAEHHELKYRIMTLEKDEAKQAFGDYKVKGIPHVVLIDRKGNVRMVKVGASDANAKAIEEMVETLIAEK